jgi:mono/diheme cytochrome c family protein
MRKRTTMGWIGSLAVGLSVTAAAMTVAQAQAKVDAPALFKQHCSLCHGVAGTTMMKNASFTDGTWLHGSSPKEVQETIANGVKGTVMVGFSAKLKPGEIEALAKHVRAFDKTLK